MEASLRVRPHSGQPHSRIVVAAGGSGQRLPLALIGWEAGAIISTWPGCPRFASQRVDQLTVARDRGGWS
jgi:hypothetical protein